MSKTPRRKFYHSTNPKDVVYNQKVKLDNKLPKTLSTFRPRTILVPLHWPILEMVKVIQKF